MLSPTELSIELLLIGSELLDGRTADVNGAFLGRFLQGRGLKLSKVTILPDNKNILVSFFQKLAQKAENEKRLHSTILITSGGLGPTLDDVTKEALGEFLGAPLKFNEKAQQLVTQHYLNFNREYKPQQNSYPMLPEGVEAMPNPRGLAPGLRSTKPYMILMAPGVPKEFQAMMEEVYYPFLQDCYPNAFKKYFRFQVRTRGVPEEEIFQGLCPELWSELGRYGDVSSLPQVRGVDITVTSDYVDEKERKEKEVLLKEIFEDSPLTPFIWQFGEKALPQLCLDEAREKKLQLGFVESCTGGKISSLFSSIPGSSAVFLGGMVTYSNELKTQLLGVNPELIRRHGAVSQEVALEMARLGRERMKGDIVVSTTGIAGPTGGSSEKPVGMICLGLASSKHLEAKTFYLKGDRGALQERFAQEAMYLLLQEIRRIS